MKAIILAAGYGRRMRPLTEKCHKTLLKIGGTTIIERIVDSLLAQSIADIIIVTGYQAEELKAFLRCRYRDIPFTFVHNEQYATTNNIHSLNLAISSVPIDDDILLIESDLIYENAVLDRILASEHRNAALVDRYRGGMDGTVVTVEDGIITSIIPPHLQKGDFDFSNKYKTLNIYRFSKDFCKDTFFKLLSFYSGAIDNNCYYELILGILIYLQRENIYAEILDGERWSELDDPNDLRVTEFIFSEQSRAELLTRSFGGYWNYPFLDFSFVRNMYFPSGAMLAEIRTSLPDLLVNYGSSQEILNEKCAFFVGCAAKNIILLNGAAQAFPLLAEYFCNRQILVPDPTFGEFTRLFPGCRFYSDLFGISLDEIRKRSSECDVVVFVNPNNPTGSYIPPEEIAFFAQQNPEKIVLVDESFIEFAAHPGIISLLEESPLANVIVLKSLSKVLGVPGLRLGFLYSCNRDFNEFAMRRIPVWNSNSIAEFFLEIVLKHRDSLAVSISSTIRDREEFAAMLSEIPCIQRVIPSRANFLVIELTTTVSNPEMIVPDLLAKKSILVKDVSGRFGNGKHYFRLAVRLPGENRRLVQCLQEILQS
ncbi:MAG: aminotransferase class I/II-fold pyridoxal phosphate-dependent enzyme [Methanomicrobiales archaeon]|nr:aminotransferase class I/II-fold pyridoxal phosphate-dependent enzyme [Methanomicrobiales archaeon]